MTEQPRAGDPAMPFASSLSGDAPSDGSIRSVAVHCFALIALATLLILVILPAVLGAAGIQVVAAV